MGGRESETWGNSSNHIWGTATGYFVRLDCPFVIYLQITMITAMVHGGKIGSVFVWIPANHCTAKLRTTVIQQSAGMKGYPGYGPVQCLHFIIKENEIQKWKIPCQMSHSQ